MSQIFNYFKNFLHPNSNQDRKRRRTEVTTEGAQLPKYRRVSSHFPKQYNNRIDDEIDHFQQVKLNRQYYNETLENYLMEQQNQQRKQFRSVNDEEFSDEEDIVRLPALNSRRPNTQASTSGYNFTSNRQYPPSSSGASFNFASQRHHHNDQQFMSTTRKPVPRLTRNIPELVPIKHSGVQSQPMQMSNGYSSNGFSNNFNTQPTPDRRRSVFDFTKKNRAFNDSPRNMQSTKTSSSVLDRNHNLDLKAKYDNLLKRLIPRFAQRGHQKYSNDAPVNSVGQLIETVDLSSDETEASVAAAVDVDIYQTNRFQSLHRKSQFEFKKPTFVDLSDDDESPQNFNRESVLSSTLIQKKKDEASSPVSSQRKSLSSTSVSVPEIAPVNSLRDRQQSRKCLQDDAISSIVKLYGEKQKVKDSEIVDAKYSASKASNETAAHEKLQQRNLQETLSSLKQFVIFDEEEEVVDEFPPLTERQLQVVRFGLHGAPGEVIVSKFSMNISRKDLQTLDGLQWLNDGVINFYMELIKLRSEEVEHLPKVHVMNTFFIGKLMQQGHSGVRRWTRKVDIFSYDIIPVPVHVGGVHWCMSVIHMRNKTISYYDSMGHANMAVLDALEQYLKDESMDKKKEPFDTSDWTIECVRDCPQQRNGSDCGVFSCMFAEFLSRDSKISFDQQHMQYFRRKMVCEIATGKLVLGYD